MYRTADAPSMETERLDCTFFAANMEDLPPRAAGLRPERDARPSHDDQRVVWYKGQPDWPT